MKKVLVSALLAVVLIGGGLFTKVVLFPVHTVERSANVAYEVVDETLTGENAIYNYEWFKRKEATIRANIEKEAQLEDEHAAFVAQLPEDRADWSDFDKQEEASLRNALSAQQKITISAMEDYNAKSEMANRAVFKDNLPANITRAFYSGLNLTK